MTAVQRIEVDIKTPRAFLPLIAPSRYKGAHGGRGSGKSHFFAELLISYALRRKGLRVVCVREYQKSLEQSSKRLLEDKIEAFGVQPLFRVTDKYIQLPGDGNIIFQGMQNHTAQSIKSLEGYDLVWVEEAQALSQYSMDLLRPTIRKPNSELWFSWNPYDPKDPVDRLFRSTEKPPGTVVVEANFSENPHFPKVLRTDMEWDRRRDMDKYLHVWMGQYRRLSEARIFKNWRVEEFSTPPYARFYFGADFGFSIDPTALVRCFIEGGTLYIDQEAVQVGCEIDNTPALFRTVPDSTKWPMTADSARPETISYLKRNGYPRIQPSLKGRGSVEEGIEFIKNFDLVVHPRCKHLERELATFSYKIDKKTEEILPVIDESHANHVNVIDALRYALEATRRSTYTLRSVE
jgi:phage terminase large subunit